MSNRRGIIAISGKSGCGNTTVTHLVSKQLGFRVINYTFRTMAQEMGVSFEELCALAEKDDSYDLKLDRKQVELAREGNCVLGSRLAIWLLQNEADLTVFLDASLEVRAERIAAREGGTVIEVLEKTVARDQRDHERYKRIYGYNNDDYRFADLIIDTSVSDQYEVALQIVEQYRNLDGD
ncbi:(d)CMP kinase [Marispirochaeta sp.]|uniref:(d)CMP kinase n=1 Tax=Marispirochaeta sp. TaxID=2038653 RepID=UPI0029C63BAA|nr:cytidylate kinase family protein [Marispirochaeta sp.]